MHPSILLDLLRTGYLKREQLSVEEIDAVQVLMVQRAIEGYIQPLPTVAPEPEVVEVKPKPHGKLIGNWGGAVRKRPRKKRVA